MQAFRKFGGSRAMQLAATWNKPVIIQSMKFRDLTFKPEEFTGAHDDDFLRTEEDMRQRKTMRANFMRIQSLPENAYEKYVLQQMLSKINSIFNFHLFRLDNFTNYYLTDTLLSPRIQSQRRTPRKVSGRDGAFTTGEWHYPSDLSCFYRYSRWR